MKSFEKPVPPDESPKLFKIMRQVVDGEAQVPDLPDEPVIKRQVIDNITIPNFKDSKSPAKFSNGMSAMHEWEAKKENEEDERKAA